MFKTLCLLLLQAKLAFIRLPIPRIYHPFISGPFNQTVKDIMERTNTRVNIPPVSLAKDEVSISGEKEGVIVAECEIKHIYETRVSGCMLQIIFVKQLDDLPKSCLFQVRSIIRPHLCMRCRLL